MQNDLVSVVVTTKNAARTLRACLASVRSQTWLPLELIVVDNYSTDATPAISAEFADRFVLADGERSRQRNIGIALARGRHILIIDADMVLGCDVVESALQSKRELAAAAIAIPEVSFGQGFWARCKALERSFYRNDPIVSAARLFERDHLLSLGGYDEALIGAEDWDLSLRACGGQPPAFTKAIIGHDEGSPALWDYVRKKYYYGRSMPRFLRKHGRAAVARLNPLRGALVRNVGAIFKDPILGIGLVILKAAEFAALVVGMLSRGRLGAEYVYPPTLSVPTGKT